MKRELLIDENRGVYIPQRFYENFDLKQWGLNPADYTDLSSPDNEFYWERWDELLANAVYVEPGREDGLGGLTAPIVWTLDQDGDLWAVSGETDDESEGSDETL